MTVCKDETSLEIINNNNLTNNFAHSSTITLRQLTELTAEFENGISDTINDTLSKMIKYYGENQFYSSLISYNNFISQQQKFDNLANYTNILDRVSQNVAITPIEYAEFIDSYVYTPTTIITAITSTTSKLLGQINLFYGDRFSKSSMGTFCALAPKIFGAVENFFATIGNMATKIGDIINSIQNFNLASMLDKLKKSIIAVVEKQIEKIKNMIQNFSMSNIIDSTTTFINTKILGKFLILKEEAMKFFNKSNIENFMKKIEGLIAYAANVFKNPTIEEIQFLIYRFCSFASQVEDIISAVKNPLDIFSNSYKDAYGLLKSNSISNTIRAVTSGGLRFDDVVRKTAYDSGIAAAAVAGNSMPLSEAELDIGNITQWNEGKGDSRLTFSGRWVSKLGEEGWTGVEPTIRAKLMRLQALMGRQLILVSGLRPKWYNDWLISIGVKAAKNSSHIQGIACDISFAGFDDTSMEQFIAFAKAEEFKGFGRYRKSKFVHIDMANEREWYGV